jgi:hypothetical protein
VNQRIGRTQGHSLAIREAGQSSSFRIFLTENQRREKIVITENPEPRVAWTYDRRLIKPITKHLLSHAFWKVYLVNNDPLLAEGESLLSDEKIKLIKRPKDS